MREQDDREPGAANQPEQSSTRLSKRSRRSAKRPPERLPDPPAPKEENDPS
jgi:hypothetical protein